MSRGRYSHRGQPCFYCGHEADGYDHKKSRSAGGLDIGSNLVPSCQRCNSRKGAMSVDEFRLYLGLVDGTMPVAFYGDREAPAKRDWLIVASASGRRRLFAYNRAAIA